MKLRNLISYLIIIFLTIFFWCCSQKEDLSVSGNFRKKEIDSLLVDIIKVRDSAPGTIDSLSNIIIDLSKKINYAEGEIAGIQQKAIGCYLQSKDGKAEEFCQLVLKNLENNPALDSTFQNKMAGSAYMMLGLINQRQGKYEESISLQIKSLKYFEAIESWINVANAYINISENFRFIKNFEKALDYNKTAEEYLTKVDVPAGLIKVLQNRGIFPN